MKNSIKMVIVAITLIYATGCTVPKYYLSIQTTLDETEQFNNVGSLSTSNADFDRSIAILPAQYPTTSGSVMNAGERKFFNESLDSCLNLYYDEKYTIHSSSTTMYAINDNGLTEDYSTLINDYRNTSILSRNKIEKMSSVLKSRYMLYTEFIDKDDKTQVTLYGAGIYGTNANMNIGVKDIIMSYQLWDSKYSKPIFETIVSTGTLANNITSGEMPYNTIVAKNISAFAQEIKNKDGQSVCPDCPTSRQEYNDKIQSASTGNYLLGVTIGVLAAVVIILLLSPSPKP